MCYLWLFPVYNSLPCKLLAFSTVYNMEHGRDPLSRTVAALCHLQLCLQGSVLTASKQSALTGGKSKSRDMLHLSLALSISSSTLFFLTSYFFLSLLNATCTPTCTTTTTFYLACRSHDTRLYWKLACA